MGKDHYDTLGVQKTASPGEIKKAFRELANEHHPDKGGNETKFKEINEAYSILSNPDKRRQYDNPMPNFGNNPFAGFAQGFRGFDFGPTGPRQKPVDIPSRGGDLKFVLDVPLRHFVFGGEVDLNISYDEACSICNGKGYTKADRCDGCNGAGRRVEVNEGQGIYTQTVTTCPKCQGKGEVSTKDCDDCNGSGKHHVENKEFKIPIQNGVRDGMVVTQPGVGRVGVNGGPNGNLHVKLRMVMPDPGSLTKKQRKVLEEL